MVCSRGPQSFSLNRKIKIKSKVPVLKVVSDILMKKMDIRQDGQAAIECLSEVVRLLEALRLSH
jgi:hypothetical protein